VNTPIPFECVVPKVKGKPLSRAKRALVTSHCSVGKITRAYSSVKSGVVLAQEPPAGKRLPKGAKVGLVVSKGTRA
jgi:serine/threonine-protein kinase